MPLPPPRLLAVLAVGLVGCSGPTDTAPVTGSGPTPTASAPAPLSEGDQLACGRFRAPRSEAASTLAVLSDPANPATGQDSPVSGLLQRSADEIESAATSASDAELAEDMAAAARALGQVRFVDGRPEQGSVEAFRLAGQRVTGRCDLRT